MLQQAVNGLSLYWMWELSPTAIKQEGGKWYHVSVCYTWMWNVFIFKVRYAYVYFYVLCKQAVFSLYLCIHWCINVHALLCREQVVLSAKRDSVQQNHNFITIKIACYNTFNQCIFATVHRIPFEFPKLVSTPISIYGNQFWYSTYFV